MENGNILCLNPNKSKKEIVECYSELFDLKTLEKIIKEGNNEIEIYTCFNCTKQMEYICKWCKENCHGHKYHFENNNINIRKINKIQKQKITNFNCICKQNNHNINKNTSYKELYELINKSNNFSSIKFYDSINEIIKNMINNKDYEEFFELLFFIKDNNIEFKKIFKYNDPIWNDLIKISDEKIKTNIIYFYFEFYIYDYFIIYDDNKKYKANLLLWFYDKAINNKYIIYNDYINDIMEAKIKIYCKLNIIQPISFLREEGISIENIFEYLLHSEFILDIQNLEFLLGNFLIKYSSLPIIENNNNDQFNIMNSSNYKEESNLILIKTANDLEIIEDFLELGYTTKTSFINKSNNLLKRLLIEMYNKNNKYLFPFMKIMLLNNKIISSYDQLFSNKDKILFMLYFYSNKDKISKINDYDFDINKILLIIDDCCNELQNITKRIDKFLLYQKIEDLIIYIYKYYNDIKIEVLDEFFNKFIKLINLVIRDEGKYFFINSYCITIILNLIIKDLVLKNEIHLNYFFSFIDILKSLPNSEIENLINSFLISVKNFKKENKCLFYYLLINPEIEEISFIKSEKYEELFKEMSDYYLKIFEIKRIQSLIEYFKDYDSNITVDELIKNIIKKIINKNNNFFEFSLQRYESKDNKILEKELDDMNKNNTISDIYILYFIKNMISLENKFPYLSQNIFINFASFLNFKKKNKSESNKYNNIKIIKNEKIPICIKSLLLKFILKLGLTLKIDKFNQIFRPFTNKQEMIRKEIIKLDNLSTQEKIDCSYNKFEKNDLSYNFIGDKIYEEHYLVIINIFNIFNEVLENMENINVSEDNIPKALYEYSIVILKGLNFFCNMLLNSYDIFSLYFKYFQQILNNFYKSEIVFLKIFKNKIGEDGSTEKNIGILKRFKISLEKYSDLINETNYNSIYDKFLKDNDNSLFTKKEENFSCFFENNYYDNITLEEFNSYSPNNENENLKVFSNFKKWINYNNNIKDSDVIKILTSIKIKDKEKDLNLLNLFIKSFYVSILNSNSYYLLKYDELYLLIRIFKLNKKYIEYGFNSEMQIKTKNGIKNIPKEEIPLAFIGKLIKSINYYCNYEISISNSFCNTNQENIISNYANALIILLTTIADNFDEYIFNYNYDFTNNNCLESFPNNNLDSQNEENQELLYNVTYSPYECMIRLYQKIYESLIVNYFYNEKDIKPNQNNLLILFYSITNFLISFNPLKIEKHKNKISYLLNRFFKIHLNQNILKFIDNP